MKTNTGRPDNKKRVSTIGIKTAGGLFYPVIEEYSGTKKRIVLSTANDNQERVHISLFRSARRNMSDAFRIGVLVVDGIKARPKGQSSVELVISSTKEGEIIARAKDMDASQKEGRPPLEVSFARLDEGRKESGVSGYDDCFSAPPPGLFETPKGKSKLLRRVVVVAIAALVLGLAIRFFFFGEGRANFALASDTISSMIGSFQNRFFRPEEAEDAYLPIITEYPPLPEAEMDVFLPSSIMTNNPLEVSDLILASWKNPALHDWTFDFFIELTGSREVAANVLSGADAYGVNPALAFSLCAEESSFNPQAYNNRNGNGTVDRGLFQLNSATFPKLDTKEFYDPVINTSYGISHLAWCLKHAGSEGAALAIYNTGSAKVRSGKTSKTTLDYVTRILNRQRKIEEQFIIEYIRMSLTKACLIIETDELAGR